MILYRTDPVAVLVLVMAASIPLGQVSASNSVCNATVDVTDTDPHGTHVRSEPGGAVIATLRNPGDGWIEVHLVSQQGDWYEIDTASLIDTIHPAMLFRGKGFVHRSMLGVSGMQNGGTLYSDPAGKHVLVPHLAGDQQVELLGCAGPFLKVNVSKHIGWTKEACTNMNTTCV